MSDSQASSPALRLIAGLGNPGPEYEQTRHNVGFWLVDEIAARTGGVFRQEGRWHCALCKTRLDGHDLLLVKPTTYMNHSGQAVAAVARFFKLAPAELLVVHDELDLSPGVARLKAGGGHGGHNGLRDIHSRLGDNGYLRLRLGIGHPGTAREVTAFVLGRPPQSEREQIESAMADALDILPLLLDGKLQPAMNRLHGRGKP